MSKTSSIFPMLLLLTTSVHAQQLRDVMVGPNGKPIAVWSSPGVTSNRPIVKVVPRGTPEQVERIKTVMDYLELTYNELLLDRLWIAANGNKVEASLETFNPKWVRLRRLNGKESTVPLHKLSEESQQKVERLNHLRDVVRVWRREENKVTAHRVRKSILLMEETIETHLGDLDTLLAEMVVLDLIKRGTIGHYARLDRQLDLRMVVAEHFAKLYNDATGGEVTGEQMNRKFLRASHVEHLNTTTLTRRQEGPVTTWTYTDPADFPHTQDRITLAEYVDAMIDLAKHGADSEPQQPQWVKDPLPTPNF